VKRRGNRSQQAQRIRKCFHKSSYSPAYPSAVDLGYEALGLMVRSMGGWSRIPLKTSVLLTEIFRQLRKPNFKWVVESARDGRPFERPGR
jgi:hypothetical protein